MTLSPGQLYSAIPHTQFQDFVEMSTVRLRVLVLFNVIVALAVEAGPPGPLVGQQTDLPGLVRQFTGRNLTSTQILEGIRQSGLSREEARARLRAAGYDPRLADPYYDRLEGKAGGLLPEPDRGFVAALGNAGLLQVGAAPTLEEVLPVTSPPAATPLSDDRERPIEVFGLHLFRRATDQFEPVTTGPVDPDYRLGPGDQVILILTGDVELAYTLEVTREGFLVIPDVGQISVNGLRLQDLRDRLYDRLGRVYSGVRRGADATTFFEISLGRLRTNQVFVIGDVVRPGAYQVPAVGTVLNALYRAGGPGEVGSFRSVTVWRGGRVAAQLDLYDYLLRGDASRDIRLEQGDVVFVPPAGPQVTIRGKVRRPAIYELKSGESLQDLVRMAGGFQPDAHIRRVQVDRILPPAQRQPGRERVLLDADVTDLQIGRGPAFVLEPGDEVTVHGTLERKVGRVFLTGDVWRPGEYEFSEGKTLWGLLREADGLLPTAFLPVAHVRRLIKETGGRRLLRVSLARDEDGQPVEDIALEDLDEVQVFSVEVLRTPDSVQIFGEVKAPGVYPLAQNMTVEDLILLAGGFTERALAYEAEVRRPTEGLERQEVLAVALRVRLEGSLPHPLGQQAFAAGMGKSFDAAANGFFLRHRDQVFVRQLPGHRPPEYAVISGEVVFPGAYGLLNRRERVSDLVFRAGGVTPEAYLGGARLVRDSVLVAVDLEAALSHPGSPQDIFVRNGDELLIPPLDPTVRVRGAVAFETALTYREELGVSGYLAEAGGALAEADLDRISVEYPNGSRAITRKILLFRRYPPVRPGSSVFVPFKPEQRDRDWDALLTRTLSITSTVLTILLTVDRLR